MKILALDFGEVRTRLKIYESVNRSVPSWPVSTPLEPMLLALKIWIGIETLKFLT